MPASLRPTRRRRRRPGAGHYERTPERHGYANGTRPKKIDTPAGTVTLEVPKTAGHDEPFYPSALERGRRSCRAVMLAVAEMYIKGVSTRDAEAVMSKFGLESLSSSQVSRAAKLLDEELEAWRNRPLGEIRYLLLDARYEKVREAGVVRDAAVLSAIGIGPDQRRRVLGVSCAISEAEVHWRVFLESLVARGMRGVAYIVSDDHPGLGAARKAVLGGASWQRCQFHLAQNAIHHAPNLAIRKRIGKELRRVWDAADLKAAEAELARLVESYRDKAAKLALWLEDAIPEGLTVFSLPERHRKRMRTSNPIERSIQQEIKRQPSRSGSSQTRPPSNGSSPPSSSRSTRNGPQPTNPTSLGKPRMTDQRNSEFPDIRLRNHRYGRPGKGNDKGNVEGVVGYARRNFMTPLPRFASWDAFNGHLEEQCRNRQGNVLRGHRESIGERFVRDREALKRPLPAPFDACDKQGTRVDSLSLVRYRTNDYSVPVAYGHQEVWIRGYVHEVVIGCGAGIIARHPRSYDREDMVFDPIHYVQVLRLPSRTPEGSTVRKRWTPRGPAKTGLSARMNLKVNIENRTANGFRYAVSCG